MITTFLVILGSSIVAAVVTGAIKGQALKSATADFGFGGPTAGMFAGSFTQPQAQAVMTSLEAREGGGASTPAAARRLEDALRAAAVPPPAAAAMAADLRLLALPTDASSGQVADILWAINRDTDRVAYVTAMALRAGAPASDVLLRRAAGRDV